MSSIKKQILNFYISVKNVKKLKLIHSRGLMVYFFQSLKILTIGFKNIFLLKHVNFGKYFRLVFLNFIIIPSLVLLIAIKKTIVKLFLKMMRLRFKVGKVIKDDSIAKI